MSEYRDLILIEECARCGYYEIKSALHVHHIDGDHYNDDPDNLVVLCANCHFGLHHGVWFLSDIGIEVPESTDTTILISELKFEVQRLKQQLSKQQSSEDIIRLLFLDNINKHDKRVSVFIEYIRNVEVGRERYLTKRYVMDSREEELGFIEFLFKLPFTAFDGADEDRITTHVLTDVIVNLYKKLGYEIWKDLHINTISKMIESEFKILHTQLINGKPESVGVD